jgi:hypothetical protein
MAGGFRTILYGRSVAPGLRIAEVRDKLARHGMVHKAETANSRTDISGGTNAGLYEERLRMLRNPKASDNPYLVHIEQDDAPVDGQSGSVWLLN